MPTPLGRFTKYADLDPAHQQLVDLAWGASNNAYCFRSNFPVGSALLAQNDAGDTRMFRGCNVENDWFPATICAERNAVTTMVAEGYRHLQAVAVVCRKIPGGSPCGLCRQVLNQFGRDATLINIVDHDSNVRVATVGDLLPAASATAVGYADLAPEQKRLVNRLQSLQSRSHVPYSGSPRAAIFCAGVYGNRVRSFAGVTDDNASYGGSAAAENVAMRAARTAGFTKEALLWVTVPEVRAVNPIDGECLQVLREFGLDSRIALVGPDRATVFATIEELLPDSFGPESL